MILLPIALYTYQFGIGLWADHTKWAEFGGFFGGVLGPIVTITSVALLYIQLQAHQKQQQYSLDTLKLQKLESDISYFLNLIKPELAREISTMNNQTLNEILSSHAAEFCSVHTHYQGDADPQLIINEFAHRSFDYLLCFESLFASWHAINSHLHSIKKLDIALDMDNYQSQKARVFTTLDSYICSHLDTISMTINQNYIPHFRSSFQEARDEVQNQLKHNK
jgi:hypothetical protein